MSESVPDAIQGVYFNLVLTSEETQRSEFVPVPHVHNLRLSEIPSPPT